eukprot:12163946-Ditylum_brightwellii.AAC.1
MVHAHNHVETDGTVLFNDVDDGADGADKYLAHLSQATDCCMMERNNDNDDGLDNGDNDSVDNGVDDGVDDGAEGADKMERSKRNKHLVCNEDDDVGDGDNNGIVDDGVDGVDDSAEGADKYFAHLSQAADCCRMERSKQNEHL